MPRFVLRFIGCFCLAPPHAVEKEDYVRAVIDARVSTGHSSYSTEHLQARKRTAK
jgi:hypothetical protein